MAYQCFLAYAAAKKGGDNDDARMRAAGLYKGVYDSWPPRAFNFLPHVPELLTVNVERFCLRSPRPVEALLEFVIERSSGLLVVGPDRARIGRWRYRRASRKIREGAPCLVWFAAD